METSRRPDRDFIHSLLLLLALMAEFVFFQAMTARHQSWIYPRWYDQTQYLTEAYASYETYREHGLVFAIRDALTIAAPQGSLHACLGLLAFVIAGPSRGAALALNMGALVLLQWMTFRAVRKISGQASLAWIAVALLAALLTPWSVGPGSAVDFRLDWMAACGYGLALAAALTSGGFISAPRALAFGLVAGTTLTLRYLTLAYFLPIYLMLAGIVLLQPNRWKRIRNLLASGMVAAALAGPAFWHNREPIYNYYWLGHMDGPERQLRISSLGAIDSIKWLLTELYGTHIGPVFVLIAGCAGILLWAAAWRRKSPPGASATGDMRTSVLMVLAFLLAPAAVLSTHAVKAPQPISIMVAGVLWLFILALAPWSRRAAPRALAVISAATVLAAAAFFVRSVSVKPGTEAGAEAARINALSDYLHYRAEEAGLSRPRLAVTQLTDGFSAASFRVVAYERQRSWRTLEATLPTGLFETTPELVLERLAQSDFVCLITAADSTPWPFDRQLMALLPVTQRWCETHLRAVGAMRANGITLTLYERPDLPRPTGDSRAEFARFMTPEVPRPPTAPPLPPGRPLFTSTLPVTWAASLDCDYLLSAAYTPLTFQVENLPEGLVFDPRSDRIRGRFPRPGRYSTRVIAANSAGTTETDLVFEVQAKDAFAIMPSPGEGTLGKPVTLHFSAFDAKGKLNFIDVTDLTLGRTLARLAPGPGNGTSWQGSYQATFDTPGAHTILFRFVSHDPAKRDPYSFFDQTSEIMVRP